MATLLDGEKLSAALVPHLKQRVKKLGVHIQLGIILVGDDPASATYVKQKEKMGKRIGVGVKVFKYPKDIASRTLRQEVGRISRLPSMYGVVVQLPLPSHINPERILNAILPSRDPDLLSKTMFGAFAVGTSPILPPTVAGIMHLLQEYKIPVEGRRAVIFGAGRLIGMPVAIELMRRKVTVSVVTEHTKNPEFFTKKADLIITGTPHAAHVKGNMIQKRAAVIDAL